MTRPDLTTVASHAFVVSNDLGDIAPGSDQGLYVSDTRFLSRYELRLGGARPRFLMSLGHEQGLRPAGAGVRAAVRAALRGPTCNRRSASGLRGQPLRALVPAARTGTVVSCQPFRWIPDGPGGSTGSGLRDPVASSRAAAARAPHSARREAFPAARASPDVAAR